MHVIFDLDGTLADTHPGIAEAFAAAMGEVLPQRSIPDFMRHIGPPVRHVFRQALACEDEALLDALNAAFRHHYDNGCWQNSNPYPGIPGLLGFLNNHGVDCSVLTNKPALPTAKIIDHLNLRPHFSAIISADSVAPGFPNKSEAAAHLFHLLKLEPAHTWLIGDSEDDAAAAAACGCRFAAAAYGYGQAHLQTRYPVHLTIHNIQRLHSHFHHPLSLP